MAVGKAFIDTYKEANPNDEIVNVDLYKENIPQIDVDVFSGLGKLQSGKGFEEISSDEKVKVGRLSELCEQFISADKYVFKTSMWNFSIFFCAEEFPFITIRVFNPDFILSRIAAYRIFFFKGWKETHLFQSKGQSLP
ncbi:hypothetical protein C0971_06945 [Bacillus methanolicus]|nr:hypothetical protein C0971_06945 [Bacillus methanolicus]